LLLLGACNGQFRFDPLPVPDAATGHACALDGGQACGPGLACDPTTLHCVPWCDDANDCPTTAPLCDPIHGVCVLCLTSADCAPGKTCDPAAHDCH
jgi:hypothetical protein